MFEKWNYNDMNIYVMTAANAKESSWGTYCPQPDPKTRKLVYPQIMGTPMKTCLGDLFSVNWMEDTDSEDVSKESLMDQFTKVKQLTVKSHVMQYGQMSYESDDLDQYMSSQNNANTD